MSTKVQVDERKVLIEHMPDLIKLMKTADTLSWSMDKGIVDGPPEKGWKTNIHDGT